MKNYLILLLIFFSPLISQGQDKWDLKSCIAYGLKNHRSRNVYSNEQLAAQAKAKEALAAYLPSISINGSTDNNLKVQETIIPAGLFGPTDTRVAFTKKFTTTGTVQLDQTIYDQELITGLKANKYNSKLAALNVVANDETIIYNISTAYYQIFVYREQLEFLKANQKTYAQQLAISKLQVDKGVAMESDLNKIQVNYNNNQAEVVAAESNVTLSENQLKNAMGLALSAALNVDPSANELPTNLNLIPESNSFSESNRNEYQVAEVNTSLLDIDQKRSRAGILPKISFYGRYGGNGFGDKIGESFSTITDFSAIGLKLSMSLFDGFKRGAVYNQAHYKYLNSLENLNLDKEKYRLEYENARTKMLREQVNVENNRRNIELAQSVFKSTDLQYQKGVTGLTEWLDAQNSINDAQNNYLNSLYNFYLARIDLEKANGTLTNFYSSL